MNKTFYGEEIFPASKADNLVSYKYQGSDASLLYNYVYSPIAQFIVDKLLPVWLA